MKLIVEMPMPKNCDECPLLDESGDYPMCRATQETRGYNFDTLNKKMDKCPIKGEIVPCNECKYRGLESIGVCWNKKIACIAGKRKERR